MNISTLVCTQYLHDVEALPHAGVIDAAVTWASIQVQWLAQQLKCAMIAHLLAAQQANIACYVVHCRPLKMIVGC